MTESTVILAAGCVLQVASTTLVPEPDGWRETTRLEIEADPRCETVTVPLPARVRWVGAKVRTRYVDGTGQRLGEQRWQHLPRDLSGAGAAVLHLPDLWEGDRARLTIERHHPPGPVQVRTGGAESWEVRTTADAELTATREVAAYPRKQHLSTRQAAPDLVATARYPGHTAPPPVEALLPPASVITERHLTIEVPPGDPQVSLYPGGGATQRVELQWTVAPSVQVSGLLVPAPPGAEVHLEAQPARVAELVHDAGVPRVRVAPFEGRARVTVAWTEPDAPTFGRRRPEEADLTVRVIDGGVAWEGDAWRLAEVHGRPVIPDRERLLKALEARFRGASLPEPGTPADLRGQRPSWALAEAILPALADRALIADWPSEALWPRKLLRARRSRVVTPTEAALVVAIWARQLGFDASWALVHPRPGPAPVHSPAGYEHMVVRLEHQGETRWIDPTCDVCATFELPTRLQGAPALGLGVARTPELVPAQLTITEEPGRVTWELDGAAALHLREWLAAIPRAERQERLARRMAGEGARLTESEGLGDAGAPVRLVSTGPGGRDLLELPDDGSLEVPWIGTRTRVRVGAELRALQFVGEAVDLHLLAPPTTLTIHRPDIPAADLEGLRATLRDADQGSSASSEPSPSEGSESSL